METLSIAVSIFVGLIAIITGVSAVWKFREYRELKNRIQLDIEANIYKLGSPENVQQYTWPKMRDKRDEGEEGKPRTRVEEILLRFRNWIQRDNRDEVDEREEVEPTKTKLRTHAVEILLRFTNKGMTRFRLYNAQVGINTMHPDKAKFSRPQSHGHWNNDL